MAKLDFAKVEGGPCFFINWVVAAVAFEVWANGESFLRAESPGFAIVGLGVDENHVAKGANWS